MNIKKILYIIFILIIIFLISNYRKEELPQSKEEVLLINQDIYFWNEGAFKKESRKAIHKNAPSLKQKEADLNDNLIKESYFLEDGRLKIKENSKTVWQSPSDWYIDDFVLADSNNDGVIDINLSLWKPGNFGSSKPFWIKENDMSVKNHFFILNFEKDEIKQVWGSSNLSAPNLEFKIIDIDGDEKNDLIVIEGSYFDDWNYVAVWKWNGWGFSNEWRSEKGFFSNLEIENNHIIVTSQERL